MGDWIDLGLILIGVYLIVQTLRHFKYLTTFYGGKYPLIYFGISIVRPIFNESSRGYFSQVTDFYILTILCWVIYLVIRLGMAIRNSDAWEEGQKWRKHQIGGEFFEKHSSVYKSSSANKKASVFGAAAPPPPPKPKKEKSSSVSSKAEMPVKNSSTPKRKKDSTTRNACYNCRYWTGNRELLGAAGNFIEYEDVDAKCAPGGGRQHVKMSPRATCNSFESQF